MSSIETGSSATSSDGVEDDRPRDHRALLLAAGEVGRVLVEELLGGREADDARAPRRRAAATASRPCDEPVDIAAGGRPPAPIVIAGFSDACGSWKTICIRRRMRRAARARCELVMSSPSNTTLPPVARRGRAASGRASSCRCPTRRRARAPRPCAGRSETPSTARTDPASRPTQPVDEAAADRVVRLQVADRDERLVRSGFVCIARCSSRSSGGGLARRDLRLRAVQPARRRAGRPRAAPRAAACAAQTAIASGQRGWKRQPGGGSIRFGGAPGMEFSSVVSSEIVDRRSSRVYGCAGSAKTSRAAPSSTILPGVHDRDPVAGLGDDPEVVGDQEQGVPKLRAGRRGSPRICASTITSSDGRRLVGDQQLRLRARARARS